MPPTGKFTENKTVQTFLYSRTNHSHSLCSCERDSILTHTLERSCTLPPDSIGKIISFINGMIGIEHLNGAITADCRQENSNELFVYNCADVYTQGSKVIFYACAQMLQRHACKCSCTSKSVPILYERAPRLATKHSLNTVGFPYKVLASGY